MKLERYPDDLTKEEKIVFYDKLLSQVPDLIFQMTISETGKIRFPYLSKSVIRHFELTESEIEADTIDVLRIKVLPEDLEPFLDSIEKSKMHSGIWAHEFRCDLPKNGMKWFRVRATVEKLSDDTFVFYGRVNDNTENRNQALKLKVSEERYQFALQASSEGIWDLDISSNTVFYSSQSMKMLGFPEKDVISTIEMWDGRIHPEDLLKYQVDLEEHFQGKTLFYKNLQRVRTNSEGNEYRFILSKGKVIERDADGKPLRLIGTHSDVSLQIEKEKELKRTLEILNDQNKRLLNFAHIVSHNLRSHAGNFKMLLDIIESETNPEIKEECLVYMRSNSNELADTIENLKQLVEIHSDLKPIKQHLNLLEYLKRMTNLLAEEFNKHKVEIKINIPEGTTVYFNPAYLESILLNFSTNAVKYSHPDRTPKIHYDFEIKNGIKILSISDNGLGIDLEKHSGSLFGMYKTFHKHVNSRGIGLFMSKNQIEAMGGSIDVESKVNVGTCFKIYFNEGI